MNDFNPKNIAKRSRDRLFANLTSSINKIESRLHKIEENQNHSLGLEKELLDKISNRGTFVVSDNEIITKIFSGAKIHLDPHDLGLVPHLVLDGEWEHNITQAWLSVAKKGDVIVDIGANFGYFAVLAAQQTNRDSKTILFEANPHLVPYLKRTIAVNSFDQCCIIENLAIGDNKGKVKLNILKDFIASSSVHSPKEIDKYMHGKMESRLSSTVTVQSTTLDLYCEKNGIKELNLIKMDIEGYEDKAYEGMRKIIGKSPDVTMFVEFTKDAYDKPKDLYEKMLKDFGYIYLIDTAGRIFIPNKKDYESVISVSDEWVMPVFSKNSSLATKIQ